MGLNNLVNDGKPQPRAAFKLGLQGFENLGALLGVQPHSGVGKSDAEPERLFFDAHRQSATAGHGPQSVVAKIPENLLDIAGIDAGTQLLAIKGAHDTKIWTNLGFLFSQSEGLIQQPAHIGILKLVSFFAGILQEIGNDVIQTLRFPADNVDEMFFVFFQRHEPGQLFYRSGHCGERLADFVGDGGGKSAQGGHAFFSGNFLLQAAQLSQILEIEDVTAAAVIARAQRGDANANVTLLAVGGAKVDLFPAGNVFQAMFAGQPEVTVEFLQQAAAKSREAMTENFFSGAVEEQDAAFKIGGYQTAAHGMNDVFGEILQVAQLFALFVQFGAFAAKRLRQKAGQVGYREKAEKGA